MKQLIVAVLVLAAWIGLTSLAAWAVPLRDDPNAPPDLTLDEKWLLRVPYNPPQYDRAPSIRTDVATTVAQPAPSAPRTTRVRPPPAAPPGARGDGCGGWRPLVSTYSWDVDTACRILLCESQGNPNAVGVPTKYGTAKGLMQIMDTGSFDPATNMAQAWAKYVARGWQPWVCQ